jgi:hypothetical protein
MTTIPAPSRTVVAPPTSSRRGLGEAVDRLRQSAGRTPFLAALLLASLAGTLFSSVTAQQVTARQRAFESLADSQWVRLQVPHVAGRYEGRLLQRGPDHVVLSADPEPLRIAATTIDTLWTRGNAGKTGAIVGGLVLGTLGAVLGAAYCESIKDTEPDCNTGAATLYLGGIGLAGGALLGGLIGLAVPKWHRQYP